MSGSKGKQLSLSAFLGLEKTKTNLGQTEATSSIPARKWTNIKPKHHNPIYIDSSSDEENNQSQPLPPSKVTHHGKSIFPASVQKYCQEDSSQTPLASLSMQTRKKETIFRYTDDEGEPDNLSNSSNKIDFKVDENITVMSNKLLTPPKALKSTPIKLNTDTIEDLLLYNEELQESMKRLASSMKKLETEKQISQTPPKKNLFDSFNSDGKVYDKESNLEQTLSLKSVQKSNYNEIITGDETCLGQPQKDITDTEKKTRVVFEHGLNNYLTDLESSDIFKVPQNEPNIHILKSSITALKSSYIEIMEKYCGIIDQIPLDYFNNIEGFERQAFVKLKVVRQKCKAKMKLHQTRIKNLEIESQQQNKSSTQGSNEVDELEEEERAIRMETNFMSSNNSSVPDNYDDLIPVQNAQPNVFPKTTNWSGQCDSEEDIKMNFNNPDEDNTHSSTVLGKNDRYDDKSSRTSVHKVLDLTKCEVSEEDCELDDLIKDLKDEEALLKGKKSDYDSYSYCDFERTVSKSIDGSSRIGKEEEEIDDDGWQVYDPEQFEIMSSQAALRSKTIDRSSKNDCSNNTIDISDDDIPSTSQGLDRNHNQSKPEFSSPPSSSSTTLVPVCPKSAQKLAGKFHSNIHNDGITGEFDGQHFPHSDRVAEALRFSFGLTKFRPNQLQVINAALLGHDCFVLMPTGGGKSLCYQLPALLSEGVTIVISPLKSLILDQVNKLASLDIYAKSLSGEQGVSEWRGIYCDLETRPPRIKILYVTPEKISSSAKFQDLLDLLYSGNFISRFVIDEAHCVSQWGHDFRPDYKKLGILRHRFPKVPAMVLTATATPRVRKDILLQLNLPSCKWFLASFNRSNLKFSVLPKRGASTLNEIKSFINKQPKNASGIIYCLSRNECDKVAAEMSAAGIRSTAYHAGLTDSERETRQKDWIVDKVRVICATIAFGMGIDKPDVRFVLHYTLPKSIEGYYQEAGRAGRDGETAHCILYYNYSDMVRHKKLMDLDRSMSLDAKHVHLENLHRIVSYCENITDCRRAQQLDYFGEHFTSDQCLANRETACDNCLKRGKFQKINAIEQSRKIAHAVKDICSGRSRFTLLHMADVLKGSMIKKIIECGHNKTPYHGYLKDWDKSDILRLLRKLVIEEYLREELIVSKDIPQAYLYLGPRVAKLMKDNVPIEFSLTARDTSCKATGVLTTSSDGATKKSGGPPELRRIFERCYSDLLDLCRSIAAARNVTMASIMNMQALKAMAETLPETEADMCKIPHVTKANFDKYGSKMLEITQNYAAEKLSLLMDMDDMNEGQNSKPSSSGRNVADDLEWEAAAISQGIGNSTSGSYRGGKRKRQWRNGFSKAKKQYSGTRSNTSSWGGASNATGSPKKTTRKKPTTAKSRAGAASSRKLNTSGKATSSNSSWIGKKTGSSSGFLLMPMPTSK